MRVKHVLGLTVAILLVAGSWCEAAILVRALSSNTSEVLTYKSADPLDFMPHTIQLVSPLDEEGNPIPIPEDNVVTFVYDGTRFTTTCDGWWRNFGAPPGAEVQNRISCTVDRSGDVIPGTKVLVDLVVFDHTTYENVYSEPPGYTIDAQLRDTSSSSPFCVVDENNQAEACKWQQQNLNDPLLTQRGVPLNHWVVYARTEVTDLALSYGETAGLPFEEGQQVCVIDVDGDGDISEDEMAACIDTPQGQLCPVQAVNCEYRCSLNRQVYPTLDQCNSVCVTAGECQPEQNCTIEKYWHAVDDLGREVQDISLPASCTDPTYCSASSGDVASVCNVTFSDYGYPPSGSTSFATIYCWLIEPDSSYACGACYAREVCTTTYRCTLNGLTYPDINTCQANCEQVGSCDSLCPLGEEYACMENAGTMQCSPGICEEFSPDDIEDEDTTQGEGDKQDDGTYDESGNCLGTIYIFSGRDRRCRTAGLQTGWHNCCKGGEYWFGLAHCKGEEEQLAYMRDKGLCHYVGSYCSKKIRFIGCVQRKRTYCCFNSKLGRILQEQGRPMLASFGFSGSWGDPKNPNCRGFTAQEFQMLDFDRIDLSEWYGDIVTATQEEITNTMQQRITDFYENIQ